MAQNDGVVRDEGLSQMEAFVGLLSETRRSLSEGQAALDARADALAGQAQAATGRLHAFDDGVTSLAENFAATAHTAAVELGRLAQVAGELAAHLRGEGADALRHNEERFAAGVEGARARLEEGAGHVGTALAEVEQQADQGEEHTGALLSDQEEGFYELITSVAEADTSFGQADFDLQGALEATTSYVGESLEQYMATVFNAFFDHLENQLPPFLHGLFQDLQQSLHRQLEEYDALVESLSTELVEESDSLLRHATRQLREGLDQRDEDSSRSLSVMRDLLQETEQCGSAMSRGSQICSAYQPIAPQLAMAREVADRVQEMMDVFNPFGLG